MKFDISNSDLRRIIPNVVHEVEGEDPLVEKLRPFLLQRQMWLERHLLGPDDFLRTEHADLAVKIVVQSAFADAVPSLDLLLSPAGFAVISTEGRAPASKERVASLVGSLRSSAKSNIVVLLDICRSYPEWRSSDIGRFFAGSLLSSMEPVAFYLKGDDPFIDFASLRSLAVQFERHAEIAHFGPDVMRDARNVYISPACDVPASDLPLHDFCFWLFDEELLFILRHVDAAPADDLAVSREVARLVGRPLWLFKKNKELTDKYGALPCDALRPSFKNDTRGAFFF